MSSPTAIDLGARTPRTVLGYLRALILCVAILAPASLATVARAQAGPQTVPGPLTTKRLERLLRLYVDPSPEEASAIDAAHAGYLERFRTELEPEIRALSGSMGGGMPSRQELDRFLRESARLGAKIGEADAAFLAAAEAAMPESRREGFARIREARERQRALSGLARMAPMMFGGGGSFVDIADLLARDAVTGSVPSERRAEFDALLRQQEIRTLAQARGYGDAVRKSMGDFLEEMVALQSELMESMRAASEGAGGGEGDAEKAAEAAQAASIASMQRMMEVMRRHGSTPRRQIAANFAANKSALSQFSEIVPESALLDLRIDLATRSAGMSRFMMGAMGGGTDADPRALARRLRRDESISAEARAALPELIDRWRREQAALAERSAELSLDLDPSALMSFAPGMAAPDAATQAKVEELRSTGEKAESSNQRVLAEIAQLLGEDASRYLQSYEMGGEQGGAGGGGTRRYLVVDSIEPGEAPAETDPTAINSVSLAGIGSAPPAPTAGEILAVLALFGVDEAQSELVRVIVEDWREREWNARVAAIGEHLEAAWSKAFDSNVDPSTWGAIHAARRELASAILAADSALCADLAPALGFAVEGPEMTAVRLVRLASLKPMQGFGATDGARVANPVQVVASARVDPSVAADVFRKSADAWSALLAELPSWIEREIEGQREFDELSRVSTASASDSDDIDWEKARRAGERYAELMRESSRSSAEKAKRVTETLDAAIAAATESETVRAQLRRARLELSHPEIYRKSDNASHQIEAALRLEDLADSERARLEALAADYAAAYDAFSEQIVALALPAPGTGEPDWREYQRVAEEANNARFQRNERTEKARAEVRRILGDERASRIRGLVPDEDAVARARRERGFDPFAEDDD